MTEAGCTAREKKGDVRPERANIPPYSEVLKQELLFMQNKLKTCSDEGRSTLQYQIEQIKRDILRNSTK